MRYVDIINIVKLKIEREQGGFPSRCRSRAARSSFASKLRAPDQRFIAESAEWRAASADLPSHLHVKRSPCVPGALS